LVGILQHFQHKQATRVFKKYSYVWLGGIVIRALYILLKIAAAALSSTAIGKPLTLKCLCHQAV